jgi:hypothetical protein
MSTGEASGAALIGPATLWREVLWGELQAEQAIIIPIKNNVAERLIGSSRTELKLKVTELIRT